MPGRTRFLREFSSSLHKGHGAVFVGAGVSMAAGYPSWSSLLREIGEELGIRSSEIHDLAALAQWHILESGGATGVRNVIKAEIGKSLPLPTTVQTLARLPVRHIWTTNYDRLVERAYEQICKPLDVVSSDKDLVLRATAGATRLYKMHGSVDRLDDIVISTEDYELYRSKRGAFLPLLQAHLSSMSVLFVGMSLTDPNIRHVLSLIKESFRDAPPEHFAIVRPPKREDYKSEDEFVARSAQHRLWTKDLKRYGLLAVEIDDYDEVPNLLRQVERRVAAKRVWISGSWPLTSTDDSVAGVYNLSEKLGHMIGSNDLDLVSGAGLLVGSASIAGFIEALRGGGGWDIDRRLIVRPFPQPLAGKQPDKAQWTSLRKELARQAGIVIFIGGLKDDGGVLISAEGVREEYKLALEAGAFIIPIGAFGGVAKEIAGELIGSDLPYVGPLAARPSDIEILELSDHSSSPSDHLKVIYEIIKRHIR